MFPGYDVNLFDPRMFWLWRYSNLRFMGFYLAHHYSQTQTTFSFRWHMLRDMGWGLWPLWVPYPDHAVSGMAGADGRAHARLAVRRARESGIEVGAALYLDIEPTEFPEDKRANLIRYIDGWFREVAAHNFKPATYCHHKGIADLMLGPDFRATNPVIFPVCVAQAHTRANWKNKQFQLGAVPAVNWAVSPTDSGWISSARTIGCQFDWYRRGRDCTTFAWPEVDGRMSAARRDVDWDMSIVADPSHPLAALQVVTACDRGEDAAFHVFTVRPESIGYRYHPRAGALSEERDLHLGPHDIGPTPSAAEDSYDPCDSAAVSRRSGHVDLFVLGQDRFLRTAWMNQGDRFPTHAWAVGGAMRCRRGSPMAAVSRELDQIDLFFVSEDHRLVTQWWHPSATNWSANVRTLDGRSPRAADGYRVAGGSNIVALAQAGTSATSSRLDVFFVCVNYSLTTEAPAWGESFQVVRAAWSQTTDWAFSLLPMRAVAAATGIAAVRDVEGAIHVVTQRSHRLTTEHAVLRAQDRTWVRFAGPTPVRTDRAEHWVSFDLLQVPVGLLLIGLTSSKHLACATYRGGRWSNVAEWETAFDTGRRLSFGWLVRSQNGGELAVYGTDGDGNFVSRILIFDRAGRVSLAPAAH